MNSWRAGRMGKIIGALAIVFALGGCMSRTDGPGDAPILERDVGEPAASDHGAFEVVSDDGSATLFVPAGALPAGVEPGDIEVLALPDDPDGFDVAHYELRPDGTTFVHPLTLEVRRTVENGYGITSFLVSGGVTEGVDVDEATADPETGDIVSYRVSIPHFSEFGTTATAHRFTLEVTEPPRSVEVGASTSIALRTDAPRRFEQEWEWLKWNPFTNDPQWTHSRVSWKTDEPATSKPAYTVTSNITQDYFALANDLSSGRADHTMSFTCTAVGVFRIDASVEVRMTTRYYEEFVQIGHASTYFRLGTVSGLNTCRARVADARTDFLGGWAGAPASYAAPHIDIVGSSGLLVSDADDAAALVEAFGECGSTSAAGTVVCGAEAPAMPAGPIFVFSADHDGEIAAVDPSIYLSYGLALDDGNPDNDVYVEDPELTNLMAGTDRVYVLDVEPELGRMGMGLMRWEPELGEFVPEASSARAVVSGASITWLVSAEEIGAEDPGYRLLATGTDLYDGSVFGADMTGDGTSLDHPTR